MGIWSGISAFFSFLNIWQRRQEAAENRAAGANKQRASDQAEERKAMEKGDEKASKITDGDAADAAFRRLRK